MARHKIFFYMFTGIFWIFSPPAWPQQTQCLQYHTATEARSIMSFGSVTLELAQEKPPRVSSPEFTKEQSLFSAGRFPWLKKGSFGSPWTAPTPTGLMTGCILTPRGFNIYLLQNEKMDYPTARTKALSELVLQEKPWIASGDIERYDVSTHLIHLTKGITVTHFFGRYPLSGGGGGRRRKTYIYKRHSLCGGGRRSKMLSGNVMA